MVSLLLGNGVGFISAQDAMNRIKRRRMTDASTFADLPLKPLMCLKHLVSELFLQRHLVVWSFLGKIPSFTLRRRPKVCHQHQGRACHALQKGVVRRSETQGGSFVKWVCILIGTPCPIGGLVYLPSSERSPYVDTHPNTSLSTKSWSIF